MPAGTDSENGGFAENVDLALKQRVSINKGWLAGCRLSEVDPVGESFNLELFVRPDRNQAEWMSGWPHRLGAPLQCPALMRQIC